MMLRHFVREERREDLRQKYLASVAEVAFGSREGLRHHAEVDFVGTQTANGVATLNNVSLAGVPVGTYSDVYGFAKTCCFALFSTAQPTYQHWQSIPRDLADRGVRVHEQRFALVEV